MTKKELKRIDKRGREEIWEWEETPEVKAALEQLHATERLHQDMRERNDS